MVGWELEDNSQDETHRHSQKGAAKKTGKEKGNNHYEKFEVLNFFKVISLWNFIFLATAPSSQDSPMRDWTPTFSSGG